MEWSNENKPPLPAPTPDVWTDLQRNAWLQTAVSQQRQWLLEKLNHNNDRATQVIEESCRAMEARLLHAATCASPKSVDMSNDVSRNVSTEKKQPEPASEPPPDPPSVSPDLSPERFAPAMHHSPETPSNSEQTTRRKLERRGTTAAVAGRVQAWVTGEDGPDADDDDSKPLGGELWRRKSRSQRQVSMQHNQIRQLIQANRNVSYNLDPKSTRGKMDQCFQGRFDTCVGSLIIVNTIIMFVQLQWHGQVANASLGLDYNEWAHATGVFNGFEMFFSAVFLVEFLLRVYVYRCRFFLEAFNILDAIIVPLTALDTFVISNLSMQFSNVSFMRMIRMFRVVRAFRVMRTMGHFKELRLLMHTIVASVLALFWSMLIMFIFQLMTAILLCQTLHDFIVDPKEDYEMRLWANQFYGDGLKALYTVFELTFSGCWPNYARPVIEKVSGFYVIIFVAYVTAVVFAMTRIVSAMFLKETLQQASQAAEMMVKEKANDTKVIMANLRALFMAADTNGDGQLTQEELSRVLGFEKVRLWMAKLGVDANDPVALFNLLDTDGNGSISSETFVTCVKRLKGEARAQDLIPVVQDCKAILNHCKALREENKNLKVFLTQQQQNQLEEEEQTYS